MVNREMCVLAGRPMNSPLAQAVKYDIYFWDNSLADPKNTIRGYQDRVLNAETPDRMTQDDKRFAELSEKSRDIAEELFGTIPEYNDAEMPPQDLLVLIREMRMRGLLK